MADAIENGWSVEKAELAIMKANLPKVSPANPTSGNGTIIVSKSGDSGPPDPQVVEAAILLAAGHMSQDAIAKGIDKGDRERVMNTATSEKFQNYKLSTLMRQTIRASGEHYDGPSGTKAFAKAFERADKELRATTGFSTISLSGILGNVANKSLMDGYLGAETTWQEIAAVRSHSDFKTVTRYRLDATGGLRKVGPDGELKHLNMTETGFTNKLETFGGTISLTRQMQINDDLGAFTDYPRQMGGLGGVRIEEAVYVLILSNAGSFFSVGNKNLLTGGGSALGIDGAALGAAETNFLKQVNPNGKPIQGRPRKLVVPTALSYNADTLYSALDLDNGGTTSTIARQNKFRNRYAPVVAPYLDNTAITDQDGNALSGQSSTAWYLFMDPAVRAAIGVAFLNGQQIPTVEAEEASFNVLGTQWRIYIDFGVGFEDPTAALKNAGA